jgi:DUF4097 and DUF4098 domain-containing protein YvlB
MILAALPLSAEHFDRLFTVGKYPLLTLRQVSGDVVVQGWNRPEIRVLAAVKGSHVVADAVQQSGRVEVTSEIVGQFDESKEIVNYEIYVPAESELQIHAHEGIVRVAFVRGDIAVETRTAYVELKELAGRINVTTAGGSLLADHCSGRIEVRSASGDLKFVQPAFTSLTAYTTNGDITYEGDFEPGGTYHLSNHAGTIELRVPSYASFDLQATSIQGQVTGDVPAAPLAKVPLAWQAQPSSTQKLSGRYGGGDASVRVSSFNGTIRIRRK